jgi:hypothetical protein
MAKFKSKGVVIKAALTETPTTLLTQEAEVSVNLGDRSLVDVTTHDDTVTKSYIDSGLRETAEVDVTCEYDPAGAVHEIIRDAHENGTVVYLTLILPDTGAATWAFSGIVTSFNIPSLGTDASLQMQFKFKATGAGTFTA